MKVVYTVVDESCLNVWIYPFLIGLVAFVFWLFIIYSNRWKIKMFDKLNQLTSKLVSVVFPIIYVIAFLSAVYLYRYHVFAYNETLDKLNTGKYLIVEGVLTNYQRTNYFKVINESFDVQSIHFDIVSNDYSYYGYRPLKTEELFMEDIEVRLKYVVQGRKMIILQVEY